METAKGVLVLLTLVLLAVTFVLFVQNSTLKNRVADANALASVTRDLLTAQDVRCSAAPEQYLGLTECITPLLASDDFVRHAFRDYDPRREDSGYLVIRNENRRAYESGKFTFLFNREPIQDGCTIPGEIGYGVTCRVDFERECRQGDVIEAFYPVQDEPVRVFLMTC